MATIEEALRRMAFLAFLVAAFLAGGAGAFAGLTRYVMAPALPPTVASLSNAAFIALAERAIASAHDRQQDLGIRFRLDLEDGRAGGAQSVARIDRDVVHDNSAAGDD